jgi:hypothetical protein
MSGNEGNRISISMFTSIVGSGHPFMHSVPSLEH